MKTSIIFLNLFIICSLLFNDRYSKAALKDFSNDVKKEENKNKKSKSSKSSDRDNSSGDSCGDEIFGFFCTFILTGLVNYHLSIRYYKYPYQSGALSEFTYFDSEYFEKMSEETEIYDEPENKRSYKSSEPLYKFNENGVLVPADEDEIIKDDMDENYESVLENKKETENEEVIKKKETPEDKDIPQKRWYIAIDCGYQYARENGHGIFGSLSGKFFGVIGPEAEVKRVIDQNKDHLDYFAYGINLPVSQYNAFMAEFYIQGCNLRGVLSRDGIVLGGKFISYPHKPFVLVLKVGRQFYNYIEFWDFEARAGYVLKRFELFAGYRFMKSEFAELGGPVIGVKTIF